MTGRVITVVTHLHDTEPLDYKELHSVLEILIWAIYGPDCTLRLVVGGTDENPEENMLDFHAGMFPVTMNAAKDACSKLLGTKIEIGIRGHANPGGDVTAAIEQATEKAAKVLRRSRKCWLIRWYYPR
jgi:hypothetical protein